MQAPAGNSSSVLKVLNPSGDSTTDFASFDFFGDYPKVEGAPVLMLTPFCTLIGQIYDTKLNKKFKRHYYYNFINFI
jgi:hypothetical protein